LRYRFEMTNSADAEGGRRKGGVKAVREGVWRVDVELPREAGEPRRRVSKTVKGSEQDAEAALAALRHDVEQGGPSARRAKRSGGPRGRRRQRGSGGVTKLGHDRWLIGLEGETDPVSGDRRRHTKVVWGSRDEAEAELALLRTQLTAGKLPSGTRARDVAAACES